MKYILLLILPLIVFGQKDGGYYSYYSNNSIDEEYTIDRGVKHDEYKKYYKGQIVEKGQLKMHGWYDYGEKTSEWKYYHENGQLKIHGWYDYGEPVDEWKYYYENGDLHSEEYYNRCSYDGEIYLEYSKLYFDNGQLEKHRKYDNQKDEFNEECYNQIGYVTEYYLNGQLKSEGPIYKQYKSDLWYHNEGRVSKDFVVNDDGIIEKKEYKSDLWSYYNEDGILEKQIKYKNDKILEEFISLFYDKHKSLVNHSNSINEKTGLFNSYYHKLYGKNGLGYDKLIEEGEYVNGQKNGIWKYYLDNLKVQRHIVYGDEWVFEGNYIDGKKNGLWETYTGEYKKNVFRETTFKNDIKNGHYLEKNFQDDTYVEGSYQNNKKNGIWKTYIYYYSKGQKVKRLIKEGEYVNGELHGIWKTYDYTHGSKENKLIENNCYNMGINFNCDSVITKTFYYPNGAVESEGPIRVVDSLYHGNWNYYSEQNIILVKREFKNNFFDGQTVYFYENGNPGVVQEWNNDKLITENCFKEKNQKLMKCEKCIIRTNNNKLIK